MRKSNWWLVPGFLFLLCSNVVAETCAGSLVQKDFHPEMKEYNKEIQKNIIDYRKLERDYENAATDSPEAAELKKQMDSVHTELMKQKATFKELNSPMFPRTDFQVYGAACRDKRWVLEAKKYLLEHTDKLGGEYFVWKEKPSGKIVFSKTNPAQGTFEN